MGQKLREDKIGTLSHSGGIVTMNSSASSPSWLTIGGQQYKVTSNISFTLSGLTANSLYMIYAVQTAGVVSLVQSTNVNSVGPAGYVSWKLVGAFYSNGLAVVTFGSFVKDLAGTPETELVSYTPTLASGPTNVNLTGNWHRKGEDIFVTVGIGFLGASAAYPAINLNNITNLIIDDIRTKASSSGQAVADLGPAIFHDVGNRYWHGSIVRTGSFNVNVRTVVGGYIATESATSSVPFIPVAGDFIDVQMRYIVTGWNNTPLKDL